MRIAHGCKTFVAGIENVKNNAWKNKTFKNAERKALFAQFFGPVEKLLLKHYRMWQWGQRSSETVIYCSLGLVTAKKLPVLQILR